MLPERFGCHKVIEIIASGPLTEVYRAVQQPIGREVAIKALKASIAPSSPFAVSLAREVRVQSLLQHENIPRVFEFVQSDTSMWFSMELTDGFTLREVMDRAGKLEAAAAVAIALEVTRALVHMHEAGVVHGDLSPTNVLLSKDGRVRVVDFGSAQVEHMPATQEPVPIEALAEPHYMAPEQILGEPLEPRTDIFLLGILLYEMLSGVRPFSAKGDRTVAHSIRHDDPPRISDSHLSRQVTQLVATSLQKLPGDRYATTRELAQMLQEALAHLTTLTAKHVIAMALARARLIDRAPSTSRERPEMLGTMPGPVSLVPAIRMLVLMLGLIVLGGALIRLHFRSDAQAQPGTRGPLELAPPQAGSLRVLARPWAHVDIDGERIETTPFARPIPLSAGVHHVTLRHPQAPDERRVIRLAPGESVLLDVTMRIKRDPKPETSAPPQPSQQTP